MYGFFGLLILNTAMAIKADIIPEVCLGGVVSDGHAFGFDPNDCGAFFECVLIPGDEQLKTKSSYKIYRKNCAFGLFWSNTFLTCVLAHNVIDPPDFRCSDPCTKLDDGTRRPMFGICGGYWVCKDHTSIGVCCPENKLYNQTTAVCIPDMNGICNNTDCAPVPIDRFGCPLREVKLDKTKYIEEAYGIELVRTCPDGTIFSDCGCINDPEFHPTNFTIKECKPIFVLDFDANNLSQPGVAFEMVQIQSDAGVSTSTPGPLGNYGHFNGTSFVLIPALANRHSTAVRVVNFMMRSTSLEPDFPQTVVTNLISSGGSCTGYDCLGSIQIDIVKKYTLLHYVVTAEEYYELSTPLDDNWTRVWWVFTGQDTGLFGARSLNKEAKTKTFKGKVDERKTALVIGRPSTPFYGRHFKGDIDNFQVYDCIPDEAVDTLAFLRELQ